MMPAASVSGLYFAHPQARYFTVGRLGEDQIANYARRKGQSVEQVERWLTPKLRTNRPAADDRADRYGRGSRPAQQPSYGQPANVSQASLDEFSTTITIPISNSI